MIAFEFHLSLQSSRLTFALLMVAVCNLPAMAEDASRVNNGWKRHAIDTTSRGADGTRLTDIDGDGRPEIATGWEEGGVVRVYRHPGPDACRQAWPMVTVGTVASPEDAVLADLDADGYHDVVSCCEGKTRSVFVHWSPADADKRWNSKSWQTVSFPQLSGQQWMYACPLDINKDGAMDIVVGAKNAKAQLGWLQSPQSTSQRRELAAWSWHPLIPVGWVMSIEAVDLNADGNKDLLITDRKGKTRGVFWLENPGIGSAQSNPWKRRDIGGSDREVLFLDYADLDGDTLKDVVVAAKGATILWYRRLPGSGLPSWELREISIPENIGGQKAVAVGDLDDDGAAELLLSCESANPPRSGLVAMSFSPGSTSEPWSTRDISGPDGIKFDRIELLDVDEDGDLDVLTCEERANLGVFWYENPR